MKKNQMAFLAVGIAVLAVGFSFSARPDRLRIGLLRYGGEDTADYDPYPSLWRELSSSLESATSIDADPVFRSPVSPLDKELGRHHLVFLLGTSRFNGWSAQERQALRRWVLLGGGLLVIWNTDSAGTFDTRIRKELSETFGEGTLKPIAKDHALFRAFYLTRYIGGVIQRSRVMEGVAAGERYGVLYSANDLGGALVRGADGQYLYSCYPGGEDQRKESFKLAVNIFVYALTGTYKSDIIHSPFIEQKLRR